MRIGIVIVIAIFIFALVPVRTAGASCGSARTALSPPSGARLPPHPTIYLFDTDHDGDVYDSLSVTRDGDASDQIKFRPTKLATTPDYTVHRLELNLVSTRDVGITIRWRGEVLAHYVIADDDPIDHARVVDVMRDKHSWTCSFVDVIELAVEGNAIAYQLQWDDDRTTIVADSHVMWSGTLGDPSVLEIGHPDCLSFNVEPALLATPRSFELYALFADGSSKRLGASILQLAEHSSRLPIELLDGADVRLPRRFSIAVTTSPQWVLASGAAGGVAGAIVALLLVRRRARLRVHSSPLLE